MHRDGWYCQFLEEDLKTSLPRKLTFATSDKILDEDDRGKKSIPIQEIVKVEDSPARLPVHFADQLYRAGESGMGYTIFTVVFSDGCRQAYSSGNAVDFIRYPNGKSGLDVVAVEPHEGRGADPVTSPGWYWCLYSD